MYVTSSWRDGAGLWATSSWRDGAESEGRSSSDGLLHHPSSPVLPTKALESDHQKRKKKMKYFVAFYIDYLLKCYYFGYMGWVKM